MQISKLSLGSHFDTLNRLIVVHVLEPNSILMMTSKKVFRIDLPADGGE